MTNFVNLTPHAINVFAPDGTHQRDIPVSGLPIARPDRTDLLIPGPQIRNDAGQPIGCIGLSRM
ncbi:hypothetical protein ACT26D_06195 [Megasphaera elsdenii]|uniref:hypothetical protein n=1 Tax=Megasphaera elsdenii TaxID=907 RepID=UPI004035C32F